MASTQLKFIIVGGGIGGLTAAACLLKKGHAVEVYEQSTELGEIGAGIQVSANGGRVLHDLGLAERLEMDAVKPIDFRFRLYNSGETIQKIELGELHLAKHGIPYYHFHRADIHRILEEKVRELDPDAIRVDSKAIAFQEDKDSVTVTFENGTSATGDVLIGADGIKSVIRNKIVGQESPNYTGNVAWRGMIHADNLPKDFMERVVTNWVGPDKHIIVYWLRRGELLNFVAIVEDETWTDESWVVKAPWDELKSDFEGWHPDVQTMLDACDRDQCYRWAMNNRKPINNWRTERAVLMGDAAHPTLPFMASGAVMAIEDAAVLARAFDAENSISECLDIFQRNRMDRTARIVNESTAIGDLFHQPTEEALKQAFAGRSLSKERDDWLYSYDPLTVPLI